MGFMYKRRERVGQLLLDNQRRGHEFKGSWDPIGVWARVGGRIYSTAMAVRTLALDHEW